MYCSSSSREGDGVSGEDIDDDEEKFAVKHFQTNLCVTGGNKNKYFRKQKTLIFINYKIVLI